MFEMREFNLIVIIVICGLQRLLVLHSIYIIQEDI
jgi:hypothetical protein